MDPRYVTIAVHVVRGRVFEHGKAFSDLGCVLYTSDSESGEPGIRGRA